MRATQPLDLVHLLHGGVITAATTAMTTRTPTVASTYEPCHSKARVPTSTATSTVQTTTLSVFGTMKVHLTGSARTVTSCPLAVEI